MRRQPAHIAAPAAPPLCQAYTASALVVDVMLNDGATPSQFAAWLFPSTKVVGLVDQLGVLVQVISSTAVWEPTRSKISLGTATLKLTLALADTAPVPAAL